MRTINIKRLDWIKILGLYCSLLTAEGATGC